MKKSFKELKKDLTEKMQAYVYGWEFDTSIIIDDILTDINCGWYCYDNAYNTVIRAIYNMVNNNVDSIYINDIINANINVIYDYYRISYGF